MDKKYEMTDITKTLEDGRVLHRIRALRDIEYHPHARLIAVKGEFGGWIEKESNLSQEGCAWVGESAMVYGNAVVRDFAAVDMRATVYEDAVVCGHAIVTHWAQIYGDATVCEMSIVSERACVYGAAWVRGNSYVHGKARIYGHAIIQGSANVFDASQVHGNARVTGNSRISCNAKVHGNVTVIGRADIREFADVSEDSHYFTVGPIGSRNDFTTFYRGEDGRLYVSCGCFNGSVPEFVSKVRQTHEDSLHAAMYLAATDLALLKIDQSEDDGGNGGNDGNSDKA